jgi:hypothetical protein
MQESSGFLRKKSRLASDLYRSWMLGGRSAGQRCGRRESSERLRRERQNRTDRLKRRGQRSGSGQNGWRIMSGRVMRQPMQGWSTTIGAAEGAFGLLHLRAHGVQVVARRDHGEQQNEHAAESAEKHKRWSCRSSGAARRSSSPPQHTGGQQQGQPTQIKKKLHTNAQVLRKKTPRPTGTASRPSR